MKEIEIAKLNIPKTKRNKFEIEILSITAIDNGVEVLVKAWDKNGKQIGFGSDGSVEIERFVIINPPTLVQDASGTIERQVEDVGVVKYKEDLQEALLQSLEHTLSVKKEIFTDSNIVKGRVGNTTLTAYPAEGSSSPVDGFVRRTAASESFSAIQSGNGVDAFDSNASISARLDASTTTDEFKESIRLVFGFDTSSIGADDVSAATFSIYGAGLNETDIGDTDVDLVEATPASASALAASDYQNNIGSTRFATGKSVSGWGTAAYNDYTLNASGITAINKSGNTFYGVRLKWDLDASFTGTWSSGAKTRINVYAADQAGTANDPKLVVEHALASSESPSLSPSFSPSISPSISSSVSPSASLSPSISSSASPSISPSASPSQSPSASSSPSVSPSASPSISPSASPSQSPSASLSPSASPSFSPSISPSISSSISPSPSPSASPSISPSISPSPSWAVRSQPTTTWTERTRTTDDYT